MKKKNLSGFAAIAVLLLGSLILFTACPNDGPNDNGPATYGVSVIPPQNAGGSTVTASPQKAAAGATVTLTAAPVSPYALSAFTVTKVGTNETVPVTPDSVNPNKGTFKMPAVNVVVTTEFYDTSATPFSISIDPDMENGTVTTDPEDEAREGQTVTLTAEPDTGYALSAFTVTNDDTGETVDVTMNGSDPDKGTFKMPGADVTVSATFYDTNAGSYAITIDSGIENGSVTSDPEDEAQGGQRVTLTADPDDGFHLKEILVFTDESEEEVPVHHDTATDTWYFEMPGEDVTVTAEFESDDVERFDITYTPYTKGKIDGIEEASENTTVHIDVEPIPGYRLKAGSLKITGTGGEITATHTSGNTWTFPMPAGEVTITAEFESIDQVYLIYSDGVLNAGTAMFDGSGGGVPTPDGTGEGRGHNATALKLNTTGGGWLGFMLNQRAAENDPQIDLNTVDALSFWIKADSNTSIEKMGFGNASGTNQIAVQNFTATSDWKRVLIPIPERKTGNLGTSDPDNYFFISTGGIIGKDVYIDDMEYITAERTVKTVLIPASTLQIGAPPMTTEAVSLIGRPTITYTVMAQGFSAEDVTLSSFDDYGNETNDFAQWHTYEYAVTGDVSEANGVLTPTAAGGSFTLALKINGVTGNVLNGTILTGQHSDPVIDGFDYYTAQVNGGDVSEHGFTVSGAGWWYGLVISDNAIGRASMQAGGEAVVVTRVLPSASINNITPIIASKPTVSFGIFSRAPAANPDCSYVFELHTADGVWAAPSFSISRTLPSGIDTDSGWLTKKIPLADFMNGGDSLADEGSIVITGWKITQTGAGNMWISRIELTDPVIVKTLSEGTITGDGTLDFPATAFVGDTVTVTGVPDGGQALLSISTTPPVQVNGEGNSRTFIMPNDDVVIDAVFGAPPPDPVWLDNFAGGTYDAGDFTKPPALAAGIADVVAGNGAAGYPSGPTGNNIGVLWNSFFAGQPGNQGSGFIRENKPTTIAAGHTMLSFWVKLQAIGHGETDPDADIIPPNGYWFVISDNDDNYYGCKFSMDERYTWEEKNLNLGDFKLLDNPNTPTQAFAASDTAFSGTLIKTYGMNAIPTATEFSWILFDGVRAR